MSLSKSKCWYSNDCLHFLKCAVPFPLGNNKKQKIVKFTESGWNYCSTLSQTSHKSPKKCYLGCVMAHIYFSLAQIVVLRQAVSRNFEVNSLTIFVSYTISLLSKKKFYFIKLPSVNYKILRDRRQARKIFKLMFLKLSIGYV